MIRNKQEKAITLIALVVTIVVLLILAAISINALGGQDGIIKKGKQSKEETEISEEKEVIEISVAQAIQKNVYGNIVEENLEKALNKNIGPRDEKYQLESSKENFIVTIIESNRDYTIQKDGNVVVGRVEGTEPDNPGGGTTDPDNPGGGTTDPDNPGGGTTDPEQPTEIPGLTSGNTTCTLEPNEWTNQNVIATITTTITGYTLQTSKNGIDWTNTKSQTFTTNGTIYSRLTDGTRTGEQVSYPITNIDKTAPTVTITQQNVTTNSITTKVTATDVESGLPTTPTYTFYIKKTSEADSSYTQIQTGGIDTVTKTELEDGISYTIKVTVKDVAGNTGVVTKEITTTQIAEATSGLTDGNLKASDPVWNNGTASITLSTTTNLTIQYQVNSSTGSWISGTSVTGLKHNDVVYARLTDGINYGNYASVTITDAIAPIINVIASTPTSKAITVNVTATDNESGMPTSPIYTYYIKKTTESTFIEKASITNSNYTFDGLTQTTSYDIKVTTSDSAGNEGIGTAINTTTGTVTNGTETGAITFGTPTWNSGKASVTINTITSYSIEYQKNSISGTWTSITNGGAVNELSHGDTVYARLTDGINYGNEGSVTILDRINPIISGFTASDLTDSTISVVVTTSDGESGIAKIEYSNNNGVSYVTGSSITATTYTFTGLTGSTTYTLKVRVTDKGGNTAENSITATTDKTEVYQDIVTAYNNGTIKIGDYVNYQPSATSNYTLLGSYSGYSGTGFGDEEDIEKVNQTVSQENLDWRVFDIKDGKIRLISATGTTEGVGFANADGYNNAVYLLHEMCSKLYKGPKATARSMTREDLYEKLNTSVWDYPDSQYYGNIYTSKNTSGNYAYPNILKQEADQPINSYGGTLQPSDQPSIVTGKTSSSAFKIKVNNWGFNLGEPFTEANYNNSIYYSLIHADLGSSGSRTKQHWLASRGIGYQGGTIFFEVETVCSEGINNMIMFNSSNQYREYTFKLRPMITLDTSVQVLTSDTTYNGSSALTAWKIK